MLASSAKVAADVVVRARLLVAAIRPLPGGATTLLPVVAVTMIRLPADAATTRLLPVAVTAMTPLPLVVVTAKRVFPGMKQRRKSEMAMRRARCCPARIRRKKQGKDLLACCVLRKGKEEKGKEEEIPTSLYSLFGLKL
jgi:hypothetical protein